MLAKLTSVQAFEPVNELLLQLLSEFDGELVRTEAEGASSEWKKHFTKKVKKRNFTYFFGSHIRRKLFPYLRTAAGVRCHPYFVLKNSSSSYNLSETWDKTSFSDFVQKSRNEFIFLLITFFLFTMYESFSVTSAMMSFRVDECQWKKPQNCRLQMQRFYKTKSNHFSLFENKVLKQAKPNGFIYQLSPPDCKPITVAALLYQARNQKSFNYSWQPWNRIGIVNRKTL